MGAFTSVLIYPHQRLRHVRAEVERLSVDVMRLYDLDVSGLCWAECREGVLARLDGGVCPEMLARIPSAKLEGSALLAVFRPEEGWSYQLCCKGTVEDSFRRPAEGDSVSPEQHAARLARRFRVDREALLACLTREEAFDLEAFFRILAPWAAELLAADRLEPAQPAPVPDNSSPRVNSSGAEQSPSGPEPGACLPFLAAVRAVRRGWPFPLSLLYRLFPQKRPVPETIPHQDWTGRELEEVLNRFYTGKLNRLELEFTLRGKGTYVRRLGKAVYQPFRLTLELIREGKRCMCLLLDGQDRTVYRLIADRNTYMTVDISQLEHTVFCGQDVEAYTVFQGSLPETFRRETSLLLSRLENRDGVLSATARMGVWSCLGLHFNEEQHEQQRKAWCLES